MLEQTRAVLGLACLAAALFPHAASAQVIDVAINGRVTDRAGRALPGSVVTVLNEETGLTRTAAADTTGAYRLPALPAGAYTMKAELAGFQPVVRRGQTLHVGTAVAIDFVLDATAATTVEVAATVPLLETTRNTLSRLISRQELETLPVIDRKFNALAALAPGVTATGTWTAFQPRGWRTGSSACRMGRTGFGSFRSSPGNTPWSSAVHPAAR